MLLFEGAGNNYDEIITWFPVWYKEFREMDALFRMHGSRLDENRTAIIQAIDNNFIDYADAPTIAKLEEAFKIVYDSPRSLEERRSVIRALIIGQGRIGRREIIEIVSAFTDGEVRVAFTGGVVYIYITHDVNDVFNLGDLRFTLRNKIPAHLPFEMKHGIFDTAVVYVAAAASGVYYKITAEVNVYGLE
ncbi:MAG: YmfQ family protein [Oscillospiraceae bacterium]|jgi:hypothetical protein|nr:YmfQ family protein [Oscillospiraceae bacterium]